jgi:glycine/D-amino acid oxidase-like deaminating enzyme
MSDKRVTPDTSDFAAYGSSFFAATMVPNVERPALNLDLDVDVCVIGGGLAGLTTAREIARRGWSVVVLEGRRIAWNASGRNTGFVLPGYGQDTHTIIRRVGLERAKVLWALSEAGLNYVRETIAETSMPDVSLTEGGWLLVSKADRADDVRDETAFLRSTFGADVAMWPTLKVRRHLKTSYFQAIHYRNAFHIHPLNYALGLAKSAEEAGVRIFEQTPALSIDPVGVRKRVVTPNARVRAANVVLAGNVHLGELMPSVSRTLVPVTTYVAATTPLGDRVNEAIAFSGSVSDTEWADNHYRLAGDRLIWSGRMTVHESSPGKYAKRLRRDIARIFPQLGKVEFEYAWRGTLGNPVHRMPQIGEMQPGLWVASGFGGHGLNTTAMAGNLIARAIVEGSKAWQHFEPFEMVWAGGPFGRVAAKISYLAYSTRESVAARLARRQERLRERKSVVDEKQANRTWARLKKEDAPDFERAEQPVYSPDAAVEAAKPLKKVRRKKAAT